MELTGTVNDGVVILDQTCVVPNGTRVKVQVDIEPKPTSATGTQGLGKRLLKHAGTVPGLPEDLAEQHDHYLHGTPKR